MSQNSNRTNLMFSVDERTDFPDPYFPYEKFATAMYRKVMEESYSNEESDLYEEEDDLEEIDEGYSSN